MKGIKLMRTNGFSRGSRTFSCSRHVSDWIAASTEMRVEDFKFYTPRMHCMAQPLHRITFLKSGTFKWGGPKWGVRFFSVTSK